MSDTDMRLLGRKKGKNENPVTAYVKVVGSDNGACEGTDGKPGCDANYRLIAQQYEDGTVSGTFLDVGSFGTGEPYQLEADINCLNFINPTEDGGIAVEFSGPWTKFAFPTDSGALDWLLGRDFLGAAKIDKDGNAFYTFDRVRRDDPELCKTTALDNVFKDDFFIFTGGLVEIQDDVQSAPWTNKAD